MADELDPVEGELGDIVAPVDDPNVNDESKTDPVEALAAEMGWKPKEQFEGDEGKWRPAADFIKAGRDINRNLSSDLRSVRDEVSRLTRTSAQLLEDKLSERDQYWRNVQAKAVEDGDADMVDRAVSERLKLKQSTPPADDLPPETREFMARNKWMDSDPLAAARAKEIAERLARAGHDVPTQLREAERAIRKEFPEHFTPPVKQPAAVTTATSRNTNVSSRVKGFNDMPADSQKMAREYERRHGIKPEDFAKSYWADQAKQRRA